MPLISRVSGHRATEAPIQVAALYVDLRRGPYGSLPGVDAWGEARDARLYEGPWPVVAHPSCASWGRFAWRANPRFHDCALRAVEQVRGWSGVLEHPSGSKLWVEASLPKPGEPVDEYGGYTVSVDQCDWGHPCRKHTWLYIVRRNLPPIPPSCDPTHCIEPHGRGGALRLPRLPKTQRHVTPPAFAEWLVQLATGPEVELV